MLRKIIVLTVVCSFAACASCFAEILTLQMAKEKVLAAAKLVEAEGESAFPKIKDPTGEFRFGDGKGYIWIHSLEGKMLLHPTQPELENTDVSDLHDSTGYRFILKMNELVESYGSGWVVYLWPKPGKKIEEFKGSFVTLVRKGGKSYVLGCGMYDINADYIKATFPSDKVITSK